VSGDELHQLISLTLELWPSYQPGEVAVDAWLGTVGDLAFDETKKALFAMSAEERYFPGPGWLQRKVVGAPGDYLAKLDRELDLLHQAQDAGKATQW
jgi:hypothetical protein